MMNVLAKLCFFILFPYWVSAVIPPQEVPEIPQEIAEASQEIAEASQEIAEASQEGSEVPQEVVEALQEMAETSSGVTDVPNVLNMPDLVSVFWFKQKLDHFLSTDTRTWKQRYFVNGNHTNPGGPVFLMVGGLKEIEESEIRFGSWIEYAKNAGAIIYYLEHRFYGQSHPTENSHTDNLVYLNTEQALADLAWFIVRMKENTYSVISRTAKWIAFGSSYGGTLAARLRLKYPHLVYAAVTSSAPFLEILYDIEYFEVIGHELDNTFPGVKNEVKKAFEMIQTEIDNNNTRELAKKFNTCTFLETHNKEKNIRYFFWNLANTVAHVLQFGHFELAKVKYEVLSIIMAGRPFISALDRFASAVSKIIDICHAVCLSVDYDAAIEAYQVTSWTVGNPLSFTLSGGIGTRQNLYQHCTELGQFETSDQESGLFGNKFPVEFFIDICTDVFGNKFDVHRLSEGILRTKRFYGGLDIDVSRVLFVNGNQDPWNILGITKSKPNDRIAINIENAYHCDDLRPGNQYSMLRAAKSLIFSILMRWLRR